MKTLFASLVILCGVSSAAAAQSRWELAPALGMYFPTRSSYLVGDGLKRQIPAAALSVQLGYWANARLGMEANLAFSPSLVAYETPGRIRDIHAAVTTAGARFVWRFADFRLGAGAGMVNSVWAPQVSAAVRVPLTRTLSADFQMLDFIRSPRHDIISTLGVVIPL